MKSLPFIKSFIQQMDERLIAKYDKITTREDFIKFFFWFDTMASLNRDGEFVSFSIHKARLKKDFGLKCHQGKRIWKLDEMIKKAIEAGIIGSTGYSNFEGKRYTRKYYYTVDFAEAITISKIEIVYEKANYKDYHGAHNILIPIDPGLRAQYDLLTSDRFYIDFEESCQTLIKIYSNKVKSYTLSKPQALQRLKLQITRLMHLKDKIIFVKTDKISGRVFTSFTLIKKEVRALCKIDGAPLVAVDLKSSQPFLWLRLLKKEYPNNNQIEKLFRILLEKDIYIHFKELFVFENGSPDYEEWDKESKKTIKHSILNRDDAKREFMRYLFKAPKGEVPFQKICKVYYPDVYKLTQELKKKSGNLAVFLQKLEADIFIPIQNEFVHKGCLSVHDCLYVKKEDEKAATERLIEQIKIIFNNN